MPKIDLQKAPTGSGSSYPAPFDQPCRGRSWHRLGLAAGLTRLGVSLVRLDPGAWSSQRHWHTHEDEFVHVLSGELVLVTDDGEEVLRAGDSAGFPAGVKNGHKLENRTAADATFLVASNRSDEDGGEYSDIDMAFKPGRYAGGGGYFHKDGSPY